MSPPNRSKSNSPISFRGAVGARLLKYSNRFTAYSIDPIELKLGIIILDINLHNRYEQDFQSAEGELRVSNFFCRRHLYMFPCLAVAEISSRDDCSVLSSLFFKYYNRYFVSVSMCKSVESTTFVRNIFSDFPCNKRHWNIMRDLTFSYPSKSPVESRYNGLQGTGEKVHLNGSPSYRGFHQMGKIHGF